MPFAIVATWQQPPRSCTAPCWAHATVEPPAGAGQARVSVDVGLPGGGGPPCTVAVVKPRTHRGLWWAAGITAALLLAGAAVVASFAVQFSGGWDDVLDPSTTQPGDPEVVAARQSAAATVDAEVTRVSRQVVEPAMATARVALPAVTGPPAAPGTQETDGGDRVTGSYCAIGQHNWKRDDPYDVSCREVRREVLAGRADTIAGDLRAVHEALLADGYAPVGDGLPEELARIPVPAPTGGGTAASEPSSPAEVPYLSAWYAAGDLNVHVTTGLHDIAADEQPGLAPGEYPLLVEVTLASYRD